MMFSILVPVYNVENYLSQCIESVISQSCQDYELILINDGSKDSSGEICNHYRQIYPDCIRVFHQENKGLLISRRIAISKAKGQFCIFVDSDDYLRKDALEVIMKTIQESEADMVIYNYVRFDNKGIQYGRSPVFPNKKIFNEENKHELYSILLSDDSLNNLVIKAVKTTIIDRDHDYSGARHVSNAEDLLQSLPLVTNAKKIIYIDEALYYYRYNNSSMTVSFNPSWYDSVTYVYEQLKRYMKIWHLDNEYGKGLFSHRYIYFIIIQTIRQIAHPLCKFNKNYRRDYIKKLSGDKQFIEAYESVDKHYLSVLWRVILFLLYKKEISIILFITDIKRYIAKRVRKKRNGICVQKKQ